MKGPSKRLPKPRKVPAKAKPAKAKAAAAAAPPEVGAAILAVRTASGLSQIDLAAKLKTSQANIVRLEKAAASRPPEPCSALPTRPAIS